MSMPHPTQPPLDVGKTPLDALNEIEKLADAMRNSIASFAAIMRGVGANRHTTALSEGDSKVNTGSGSRVETSAFA